MPALLMLNYLRLIIFSMLLFATSAMLRLPRSPTFFAAEVLLLPASAQLATRCLLRCY